MKDHDFVYAKMLNYDYFIILKSKKIKQMKKVLLFILIILSQKIYSQHKTDVLVLGGSASGAAAAIQAARSGVKAILVEANPFLIGDVAPDMSIPAFNLGLWKEWRDSCKKDIDSLQLDPRMTLAKIISKEKKLQYFKQTEVIKIKQNKSNWEVTVKRNGKTETIKAKALVDAFFDSKLSPVINSNIIALKNGNIEGLANYSPETRENPYNTPNKLYRTSGAAGFGKDSSIHFFPLGVFIAKEKDNLLFASNFASITGFEAGTFKNIALWVNVGQMVGALAAYGPFFNTTASKAGVRLTQGEIINFKGIIYPVRDIDINDKAWYTIQKTISTQLLKFDFLTGKFNPNGEVFAEDIRPILSEVHPRSRIWFIENKIEKLTIQQVISLISFIGGKEIFDIDRELAADWQTRYDLKSEFKESNFITRKELAILFETYLSPFNVKVNMAGYFLR